MLKEKITKFYDPKAINKAQFNTKHFSAKFYGYIPKTEH